MTPNPEPNSPQYELDVLRKAKQMHEEDLLELIRDTVVRLELLAARLEGLEIDIDRDVAE